MNKTMRDLWLFDYNDSEAYDKFSQCEDPNNLITRYIEGKYDFRNKTILEIGAGSGKFTQFLAHSCKQLYVVERSASLMALNQARNKDANIKFVLSDVKRLDLPEQSIDVIFGGWSMTSMRDDFPGVFRILNKVLKPDGKIILVENAGADEFSRLTGIESLSAEMQRYYHRIGFYTDVVIITTIDLPDAEVFYHAFPNQSNTRLDSLKIRHDIAILRANAKDLPKGDEYYENC